MNLILRQYKTQEGVINFPKTMSIPTNERLPALVQKDFLQATVYVGTAITLAFEKMAFKTKPTGELIANIADEIIDTCHEDNLALEDLMLFLQGLVRGKYGNFEPSVGRFMNLLEEYRQERHEAVLAFRENQHLEFKSLGDPTRVTVPETAFEEHLQAYTNKLQEKNDELKLLRREAKDKK